MPAEIYFQLLNPLIFVLIGAGLYCTHLLRPSRSAVVLSLSYFVGATAFTVEIANTAFPPFFGVIPTTMLYVACAVLVAAGLSLRYCGRAPWGILTVAAAAHMGVYSYLHLFVDNLWFRSIEANLGAGVILLIGAVKIAGRQRQMIDRTIFALAAFNAIQCFVRPWLVLMNSGGEMTEATYSESVFVVTLHLAVGIAAIVTGMALLVAYSMEIILDLQERSVRDVLTGLMNRRGFEDAAAGILEYADRKGEAVGVIIADIDHFKSANDEYGHAFGDLVIAEFGDLIASYAVDQRIASRIGGEEFALLLPGENCVETHELADAIRREFEKRVFETAEGAHSFTASFGAAERKPGEDLRQVLAKADEALYLAKSAGRNKVMGEADVGVEKLKDALGKLDRRRIRSSAAVSEADKAQTWPQKTGFSAEI